MLPQKQATMAKVPGGVNETEPDDHSMITFNKSVYDAWFTSTSNQIEDGDIIFFRKQCTPESEEQVQFPDVPSFLEYVKNRQIVNFRALERPTEDAFILELAKNHTYDDIVERVAQQLGLDDPSKIRLTSHDCYSKQPKAGPIKYRSGEKLIDMLVHYNQISYIMYYEVLDIPLPEIDLQTMEVSFFHATKDEVTIHSVRLPKQSTVRDVLNEIKSKVELSHPNAQLRLLEVFSNKIYKVFPLNEKVEIVNDQYWALRAEEQQKDEEMLLPQSDFVEGPQPLVEGPQPREVAQAENASTVENQPVDEPQASRFTWTIENFSRLNVKKHYSDVFIVGSYKWRILIFPKGNNVDYLSMYLDVADSATLPYGWSKYAQFSLAVVNQINNKYTIKKDSKHQFNQEEHDWGFTSFMPLSELYDTSRGYIVNDTCVVEADVAVRKVTDY